VVNASLPSSAQRFARQTAGPNISHRLGGLVVNAFGVTKFNLGGSHQVASDPLHRQTAPILGQVPRTGSMLPPIDEIVANFELLDDWDDRYRYLIELGRMMPDLPPEAHSAANKVPGCASQVWLDVRREERPDPVLHLRGDSDAHIVRGLVALLIALYSGQTASDVLRTDALSLFQELGLSEHLTPQRSNGVRSMVERIRREAAAAEAA